MILIIGDKSGDISIWNPSKNKSNKLYLIQSPIYDISSSPTVENSLAIGDIDVSVVDPHRLAIASGDNNIRFLAFGTDLGNIGWYEVYNDKSKTFNSYHKSKVYSIHWCKPEWLGQGLADENSDYSLIISCGGDGQILLSDTTKPKQSMIINDMIKEANPEWTSVMKDKSGYLPKRSEIAVHPAGKFLSIGNVDGSIEVY
ncbi:82_t:CDS:2, partial [Racocetra fulgida]